MGPWPRGTLGLRGVWTEFRDRNQRKHPRKVAVKCPKTGPCGVGSSKISCRHTFQILEKCALFPLYATYARYQSYDVDLEKVSGETHHILPVPSTYIIGTDGMIHFQYSNTDYHVRLDPEVLLTAARQMLEDTDGRLRRAWERNRE